LSVEPIVLPRPNLGPEPWPDSPAWPWITAAAVLITLVALILRRRRKRVRAKAAPAVPNEVAASPSEPSPLTDRVRGALIRAFGPSWRARTTEEVAASPVLAERFGPEVAAQVVAYLRACDRAKFSADAATPDEELDWWAARFAEEVESSGQPESTNKHANGFAKTRSTT
jgi:MYXO-CTERM domain-containing protein